MKRIIAILFGSSLFIILLYLIFSGVEEQILGRLRTPASLTVYAGLSFCFLLSDILLPVPSSMLMILNGKVLGVFWGTLLSLGSGLLSSVIGYLLGRRSGPLINRLFSKKELDSGDRLFRRYGRGAIVLSKALPVVNESVSFLSGTTNMNPGSFVAYSFCGQAIVSVVYAYAGNATNAWDSHVISALIIAATLLVAGLLQFVMCQKDPAPMPESEK